jgi:hypothetical protein
VADVPSPAQIERQEREAERLGNLAADQQRSAQSAAGRLDTLAAEASRALEAYTAARREAQQARAEARAARKASRAADAEEAAATARFEAARALAAQEKAELGRYAAAAYRSGSGAGNLALAASLLESGDVTELSRNMADLRRAGDEKGHVLERVEAAEARAAALAAEAAAAAERAHAAREAAAAALQKATEAKTRAGTAKAQSDALVAQQRDLVGSLQARALSTLDAAQAAEQEASRMQEALRVAEQRRREAERERREALARQEVVQAAPIPAAPTTVTSSGSCGGSVAGYANGRIPRSALCSLWGAEWHVLRGDAASAFNAMSKAYAGHFGRPICVTDSYRSYEMQVDVHRRKPGITAVPGTSNHGWGTAVDLCDGVNSFTSSTHAWMRQNAPTFGWFNPGWAQAGGSRPEPWHWEFAG